MAAKIMQAERSAKQKTNFVHQFQADTYLGRRQRSASRKECQTKKNNRWFEKIADI
jgi:hypothetical protein